MEFDECSLGGCLLATATTRLFHTVGRQLQTAN
jgi:hypothetical protein